MNVVKDIKFDKEQISQFEKLDISLVYIYGSQATGLAGPNSDIDIGIVFTCPEKYKDNTIKIYTKLYNIFTDVFPKKEVDVVLLQFASPTLQFKAISKGVVVYHKSKESIFRYKETVVKKYADIKYFLDLRAQEVLNRI